MPTKPEIADEIVKIYFTCLDVSEFKFVMNSKLDIYPHDTELLWYIIDQAWGAGSEDEARSWDYER